MGAPGNFPTNTAGAIQRVLDVSSIPSYSLQLNPFQ